MIHKLRGRCYGGVCILLCAAALLVLGGNLHGVAASPSLQNAEYERISLQPEALSWTADLLASAQASHDPEADSTPASDQTEWTPSHQNEAISYHSFADGGISAGSLSAEQAAKLDPYLRLGHYLWNMRQQAGEDQTGKAEVADAADEALEQVVTGLAGQTALYLDAPEPGAHVLIQTTDDAGGLEALGIPVQARLGDVATAFLPYERLAEVASLPSVVRIEASQLLQPGNDASVPEARAPQVWSGYGSTGAGVVVGVIDSGIDPFHPDFIKPDGSTRIKFMLDLSDPGDPDSDGNLNGPVFGGTMYTEAQINAALANPGWFYLSTDTPRQIPDNSVAGISSQINVAQNVSVNSAAVELYILHPYRGDLRVTLTCPSGTNVPLSSNAGGDRDHIIGTFPITACNGQNAGGAWRLTVADTVPGNRGGLVFWNLHVNRTVRMTDQVGHGTHVAGSAAGNGRGAGSGAPAGGFKGMAPDADLIIVRGATDYIGGPSTSATVNAMTFIDERAQALSKPYVINMSFGGQIGPHDGTSLHERAIDNQVGSGKPGKAIVVAAGNEGARHIHATDTVPPGGMKELTFDVSGSGLALIDIWYPGADTFKVGFRDPTGGGIDPTPLLPGQNDCWTGGGNSICIASVGNDPHNGDKSVFVLIGAGTSGRWRVKLYGHAVTNGRFDAWISGNEFTSSNVADRMRVGMPGTARNAITVGAYTTKTQWIDASGTPHSISATLGNYAAFSNDGPTRDGRQKPELSAPGQMICSTLAAQAPPGAYGSMYANANYICQGGQHGIVQGTSMAAPHVAGAVALLLSLDRSLDAQQLRNTLTGAARTDSFTGTAPNIRWGYGKLDVQAAAQALSPANTPTPTPTSTVTLPPTNTPTPTPTSTVTLPPANTPTPTPTSTVTLPPPIVNAIVPNSGENTGSVAVLISGANFQAGATVKLTATGQPDIHATGVIVASSSQIVANLNLTGAATGAWNVVVTNPNAQSGILPNGFTIIFPGKTWTGAISADWHTSGNWTPSGVPGGGDDVVIPAVIRAPVISNGNATVRNLTINSGGILDLTVRTLWVEGRLSNNGALSQTRDVSVGELAHFLRITNQAGTQTKYHGLEFTPAQIGDPGVGHAASGPIYSESLPPDEGSRWVELTLDSLPARSDTTDLATSPQAPDATISLVVDDGQHETAVGVNNNNTGKAFQFIWLNRFTPAPAAYPFALNEIWVMFDAFGGGANVRVGDAIDLVIYQDPDGNPANGANWVATVRESVKAVDGTTWSVYALASPVLLDGPGDVLIAVINRYITSGVSPVAYPATLDRTTGQNRSWIGWWSSNPPSPPLLPPNTRFSLMTGDSAGNWLIRGYGETQSAATPTPSPTPTATLTVTLPTTPTATATSTPTGTIPPPTPTATPTPTGTAQPTSERVTVSISGSQFCAGRTRGVKRCYDINPAASMVATVRFYFSETERSGQPLNDLMVFCYDGDWKEEPGPYARGGAGDALYVETQNVAGFSFFALGRSGPEMLYLPLVLKQVPVGTPTPTPTPTRTPEPTRTPTPTATTQPGRWVTNGPYGGSVSDLAMSISNPDVLYAAMSGAGLFKTANGGDVWSQVASPPEGIQRIYVAPDNPNVVYAGTANGIYKSIDGGATWTHKGLAGILVRTIAIHPSNPQVVYISARIDASTGGVYKSTDAGETWQQKLSEANLWVNTLLIDTTIPNRIYLGASGEPQGFGGVPQGLRISSDGGDSWTSRKVTTLSGEAVFVLAMTPMGYTPPTLYAAERSAMYKSTDGGLTWIRAWQTVSVHSALSLAVDAQTPHIVYAGGGGIRGLPATPTPDWYPHDQGSKSRLWRSADNGATWTRRDTGLPGEVATSIVIDPRNGRVFVGLRSAGVYRSTDGGGSWQLASHGIAATNIQGLAADPGGSGRVIAAIEGPSHPMAVTAGSGAPWHYLIGDDTPTNAGAVAVDPAHPSTWYTGDGLVLNWRWVYTFRSTDGGNTWTANQLLYKTDGPVGQVVYHRVFDMAVDPGNASTVLAAVAEQRTAYGGVYKSSDAGASWSRTLPDWATALAFDPTSPGRVYAGAVRYGKVFRSTDSGTSWTQIGGSALEALRVYDIAVAPNGHVYVATNGGLQKWNGTAWSAVTGLPPVPTIALAIDTSSNPGAVYVGTTTHGVYVSRDDGVTWTSFSEGLGNLYVTELEISNGPTRTLHAGTAYGGVWSIDISSAAE